MAIQDICRAALRDIGVSVASKHLCSFFWLSSGCQKDHGRSCQECFGKREPLIEIFEQASSKTYIVCYKGEGYSLLVFAKAPASPRSSNSSSSGRGDGGSSSSSRSSIIMTIIIIIIIIHPQTRRGKQHPLVTFGGRLSSVWGTCRPPSDFLDSKNFPRMSRAPSTLCPSSSGVGFVASLPRFVAPLPRFAVCRSSDPQGSIASIGVGGTCSDQFWSMYHLCIISRSFGSFVGHVGNMFGSLWDHVGIIFG